MRKVFLFLILVVISADINFSQVTTLWEKSAATSTNVVWNTGSVTRGLGYGMVDGNHRLYVVTRSAAYGGKQIFIYNATTGDSVGALDTTGISGGTLVLNEVEVSADGKIFACNLAAGGFFKVYRYDTEASSPVTVINYDATGLRLGDKITITGSTSDNSIVIWAVSADADGEVVKFTTTDNGATFSAAIIDVGSFTTFASASAGPLANEDFYFNAHGANAQKFSSTGTLIGTIPNAVLGTGGSAIKFMRTFLGDEYVLASALGTGLELAKIIKVPGGVPANAEIFGSTPALGTNSAGGLGDVSFRQVNDRVFQVFVLSTNNGIGAYQVTLDLPVLSLSGDYYVGNPGTGPSGSDPDFISIREAFDVLNEASFTGDCNFFITSDIFDPFTPATGYGLGLAINPEPFTVTFKPYTGVQPVITLAYPVDGTVGPSGAMIIGCPSEGNITWDSLRTTKNIVIDGSNTIGGTTRDLTIQTTTTAHRNGMPLVIVGDVSNVTVKNTNIYYKPQTVSTSGNLFIGAVMIRSRNYLSVDWVPHDLLFENNHLSGNFDGVAQNSQGYGCYQSGTPLPAAYPYNITLRDNKIEGKRRGIALYRAGSHDIYNNEIVLNQNVVANTTNEAIYGVDVDTGSVVNIYNNIFSGISSMTNNAGSGNTAISIETFGTYNVYNNMIYGFDLTAANPVAYVRGIKNSSPSATLNMYYNTLYMNDLSAGTIDYQGIYLSEGTNDIENNIVYSAEGDFANYCIYRDGTNGTVTSDNNNFYPVSTTNGNVGFWNTTAAQTLAAWQSASGQDANSVSKEVFFVSTTDLHLTGSSNGDYELAGSPIAGITEDIDGDTRNAQFPYMGCDEASVPLPVELSSFSASVVSGDVQLKWTTATETNNQGFEVQRSSGDKFITIGFVKGSGTTTDSRSYNYVDKKIVPGVYSYRLKQVDFSGAFSYGNVIEVDVTTPSTFALYQNYPNPFNPTTTIDFEIASPVNVNLIIYNMLGEQVDVLINNQITEAGIHSVTFDASNLASGTYIYRLQAGNFVETKKMMLTK